MGDAAEEARMRSIKKVLEGSPPVFRLADDGIVDERSPRLSGERSMDEDMLGTSQRVLMSGIVLFGAMRRRARN